MLAARVHAFGADPVVEDVAEPEPGPGETLVELVAAPVAQIDLTVLRGSFVHRPALPYVPGTEGGGHVASSDLHRPGTPVRLRGGGLGLTQDGTWRRVVAAPDDAVHPLPPRTDPALASIVLSPAVTAYTALHELGALRAGERVAVTGAAGSVGTLAVQLALRAGAGEVFALVGRPEKRDAVVPGAQPVLPDDRLLAAVDLLVDTVGGPRLPELVTTAMSPGGRAVLVGYTAGTAVTFDLPRLLAADVRLLPLSMLHRRPSAELARDLLELLTRGELRLPFVLRPLHEVSSAIADVRSGRSVGRVALDVRA